MSHESDAYQALYQERKAFLKAHQEVDISEFVRDSHEKGANRIHYLTDNTILERRAILEETARYGLNLATIATNAMSVYDYKQFQQRASGHFRCIA